jgi:methylmalonyl-CoA mutase N-terminal domain/subunit
LEGWQLNIDANRIIRYEARLCDVNDPLAGSYYVEALTEEVEAEARGIMEKIDAMGGAEVAIEDGFYQKQIAESAYRFQREVESGERIIVGVNAFTGEQELEVTTNRLVPHPYDPQRRARAEETQIENVKKVKRNRSNREVTESLKHLREAARDEKTNLIPVILEAVKSYSTIGEICGVLREVFGEYHSSY